MGRKISVVENSNVKLLVYETEQEKKNEVGINFAKYSDTPHLVEMNFEESNYIRGNYDISECIPIMESISGYPGRDEVFNLIKKMLYILEELRDSFICEEDLFLNKDYIYIEKKSNLIKYVLAPELRKENNSIIKVIEDILVTTNWKRIEVKSYLNVLSKAIGIPGITYSEIIDVISKELEKPIQYQPVETPASEKAQIVKNNVTVENVKLVEEDNVSDDDEGSSDTGELKPSSAAPQAPTPPAFTAPQAPTPSASAASQAPTPPVSIAPQQPQAMSTVQYDEIEEDNHFGETTVLGMSNQPMVFPALIRIKTQEKIIINKSEFYVGKDPSRVDYCVFDNSAVSRVHAKIICRNGEFFVVDNHSTNHVYVNGMLIDANVEVRLTHGSRVRLGDEDFEFRFQ